MTVLTDEIGVIGSIATAIAVVVAVVQYIQGQKSSRVQRDHEIADKLRGDLRQVAQLTLSLKEILREGLPLIRGSASIAKEFCLRLGENAVPKTFLEKIASLPPLPPLEKIASLPPSEERDPFVLLVAVEGWQSSPETKHLNAIVDKLGDATIPLYSVTATRPLGEASVLLRRIVHASYSPVPLFTNMMSKEIMREFIDTNKDQGDMAELENALAGFLFGIAALHFKEGYLEAVKYLNEYVTKYTDYLSRMDDSRLAEFLKMGVGSAPVAGTLTGKMKKLTENLAVPEDDRKSLIHLIVEIQRALRKAMPIEAGDDPPSTSDTQDPT